MLESWLVENLEIHCKWPRRVSNNFRCTLY